jgi:hypothetical protein
MSKHHTIPFGLETAVRVSSKWNMIQRVAKKYQDKIETDDGNVIYQYGPRQIADRHKKKADRLEKLKSSISDLTAKVRRDLKSPDLKKKLTALAVALINETYERVGNSTSAEDGHFGVTGWKVSHFKFKNGKAEVSYTGKSGVRQTKVIEDPSVLSVLKETCKGRPKDSSIFECDDCCVQASDVNEYLKDFDITAKDLRGYHANKEMCRLLKEFRNQGPDLPHLRKERDPILKDEFTKALEEAAKIVGHTSATLRSDYLVPGLEEGYMKDGTVIEDYKKKTASVRDNILSWVDGFGDPITLYREIIIPDIANLVLSRLGTYWTPNPKKAHSPFGHLDRAKGVPYILVVEAPRSAVDEFGTVATMKRYPDEQEIRLQEGVPVKYKGYFLKGTFVPANLRGKTASLNPVMDPHFNLRQVVKEILLLEDHLLHPENRCPDCITKHLLKIEAYAEESVGLDNVTPKLVILADVVARVSKSFLQLFGAGLQEEQQWLDMQQILRLVRKVLLPYAMRIKVATKTHAEKEDERVEKTHRRLPKKKPPREDLRKDRIHVDDKDMDHGDRGDDPDLTLNYKRVASRWELRYHTPVSLADRFVIAAKEQHGPGDVWQTDDGNWRAKNKDGEGKGGFDSEEQAQAWVDETGGKGKDEKKEEGEKEGEKENAIEEASDADVQEARDVIRKQRLEKAIRTRSEKEISKALKENPDLELDEDAVVDHIYDKVENYILNTMSLDKKEKEKNLEPDAIQKMIDDAIAEALGKVEEGKFESEEKPEEGKEEEKKEDPKIRQKEDSLWESKGKPSKRKPRVIPRNPEQKVVSSTLGGVEDALGELGDSLDDDIKETLSEWFDNAGDEEWGNFEDAYEAEVNEVAKRLTQGGEDLDKMLPGELEGVTKDTPVNDLARAVAKARFLHKSEDVKDALERHRVKEIDKKLKALGPKIEAILKPTKRGQPAVSKDVQEKLLDASIKFDADQLDRLSGTMEETLKSLKKTRPKGGEPWDASALNAASKAVAGGIKGKTPDQIGESLANIVFAEKVVLNPEFVGNPAIGKNRDYGEGKPTSKDISNRAKASYRQYQSMSETDRKSASERIKNLLKQEKNADTPRARELNAVLSGINLAQVLKGEKMTGTDVKPTKHFQALAKALKKRGQAEMLLDTMDDFTSGPSREIINSAIKSMDDSELADFAGGEKGPYSAFTKGLTEVNKDGSPKYPAHQRETFRDILSDLLTQRMSFGLGVINNIYKNKDEEVPDDWEDKADKFWKEKGGGSSSDGDILDFNFEEIEEKDWHDEALRADTKKWVEFGKELNGGRPQKGTNPAYEFLDHAVKTDNFDHVNQKTDPPLMKQARNVQSSFNRSHYISDGDLYPMSNSSGVSWSRRILMARLTKKGAKSVTHTLDRVATLFQEQHEDLGVPDKIAMDFAYRCDLLSEHIEKNAGLGKEALSEFDPVNEGSIAPQNFDPEEIGKEDSGPLQQEPDEPYMGGQFSQQEKRELRERQESGEIEKTKEGQPIYDEQSPQAGKQATLGDSIATLTRMAQDSASSISQLSGLADVMRLCQAKLSGVSSGPASDVAKKLASSIGTHLNAYTKVRDQLIDVEASGDVLDMEKEAALGRILKASSEVIPHLKEMVSELRKGASEDSPTAQLKLEEMLGGTDRVAKLMDLSSKIVSGAAKEFGKKESKEAKAPVENFSHGFDLTAE